MYQPMGTDRSCITEGFIATVRISTLRYLGCFLYKKKQRKVDNNIVFSETRCLEKVPHTKKLFIEVSFMLFVLSFDFSIVYDDIFSRVTLKSVINIIMLCHFPAFAPRA